ncbi:hypothetical protein GCM10017744_028240 [Streptomyces antimycoticus]|uniref:Uncharacterized protein n=1 Tax=Streptomyces antimycoticus TaxID=68175 RepID=A0A4D4KJJ2_9ACTN|nr:hypothetical protein SANT12839_074090 [Streptomyces antimycoticus]
MTDAHGCHVLPLGHAHSYWIEVIAFHSAWGELQGFQFGGTPADTPARAVARLRIRVRRAAWRMHQLAATRRGFEWLKDRWAMDQAIACLSEGAMYLHLVDEGDTTYEFSACPVYLPASAHLVIRPDRAARLPRRRSM